MFIRYQFQDFVSLANGQRMYQKYKLEFRVNKSRMYLFLFTHFPLSSSQSFAGVTYLRSTMYMIQLV